MAKQIHQLAAIMFTDMVGYTWLMGNNEQKALELLGQNRSIHKKFIKRYGGKLLKEMGDGMLASFPTTSDAVYCAGAIQKESQSIEGLSLRIGIHHGEVLVDKNDIYGDGVNIASRIQGLAQPNEILVSESVYNNVKNRTEIEGSFAGEHQLKNVDRPVKVYSLTANELPETRAIKKPKYHRATIGAIAILILAITFIVKPFGANKNREASTTLTSETNKKSIAVLPFDDMSPDEDQEYLGDGIAEEILNILAKIEDLKVISRTSSFQFKGEKVDIREVGEKLGVKYIVEGSVRKFGDQLRITSQLINSVDGSHIWSHNYDRTFSDLFQIQDDIAGSISEQLKSTLDINKDYIYVGTNDVEAYEYYLKGLHMHDNLWFSIERSRFNTVEGMFLKAIEIDSTFVDAHAALSDLYDSGTIMFPDDTSFKTKVIAEANIAYNLNPESSYANNAQGLVHYRDYNYDKAFTFYLKAIEINPKENNVLWNFAGLLSHLGLHDDALLVLKKALSYDPLNANLYSGIGGLHQHMGQFAEAIKVYKESLLLDNDKTNLIPLFIITCISREIDIAEKYYTEINFDEVPESMGDYWKALQLAAQGNLQALDMSKDIYIRLLLGNEKENWNDWFDTWDQYLQEIPYRCCGSGRSTVFLPDRNEQNADSAYLNLIAPLLNHPRFPSLYKKYRKCVERNAKKYSLKNTVIETL